MPITGSHSNWYISLVNDSFILTTEADLNLVKFSQNYLNDNDLQNFARSNCKKCKKKGIILLNLVNRFAMLQPVYMLIVYILYISIFFD